MDRAAYAKFESAVYSRTFTKPCKCCDAKHLVNQWQLTSHQAYCKSCLPPETPSQDVLQVCDNCITCQSLSSVLVELSIAPAPDGKICAPEHVYLLFR